MTTLAFHIGPFQFDQPFWLILAPICWALAVWIGRQSLSGMGTFSRRLALLARLGVVLLVVAAIARPYWRKEAKGVNVTVVVDVSDSVHRPRKGPDGKMMDVQAYVDAYLNAAADFAKPGDTISRLTVAKKAYVQELPSPPKDKADTQTLGQTDASNLAGGVHMALAVPGKDTEQQAAAKRILYVSDFNETTGSIQEAAGEAKTAKVPIDVLPLRYTFDQEVRVERVIAPATARMGQNIVLRVLLNSIKPAKGRLSLLVNGDQVQLGESRNELDMPLELEPGANVVSIPIALPLAGPQEFKAHFTPARPEDDAIEQNNEHMAITFVQSEGRVLLISTSTEEVEPLKRALEASKLDVRVCRPEEAPKSLVEWGAYDAVVMANTPASDFSQRQQEDIRAYVHDLAGGLVMVGGAEAFGAGGWIGSPTADALPIKLDPPQQRKMPRGALVMLMHSCEMPKGNYWGQQVCLAAINNLSRLDLAGVLEFSHTTGDKWVHPLTELGNKAAITRAINSLTFGDMPSFDNLLKMAYDDLITKAAGAKHVIIISDGDPQLVNKGLLDDYKAAKISISTVLVYPHDRSAAGQGSWATMRDIARRTGGKFHPIIDEGEFARLPSIFIKEAQVVKRSLIWEGQPFVPTISNAVSEPMRGLTTGGVPPISGYIVSAEREGLSVVTLRGKENDPILAHWQYGLGKSVAFTSDASTKWSTAWPSWGKYKAFWEQHVRWAMRPGGNADMRLTTEDLGDRTKIVVEALDSKGERQNFVHFAGRAVGPNGTTQAFELRQVGPGRYEGSIDSGASGAYVLSLGYVTPGGEGVSESIRRGTVVAAVTRPYADEFKTLKDNAPLGKQVAELTGGRVVDDDPTKANLWLRDGLTMPVDARPIWMLVSMIALGAFLLDVAVRRIRIDPHLIAAGVRKGLGRGAQQAGQQLGSLKEARQRAQQSIGERKAAPGSGAPGAAKPTGEEAQTARVKFEVSDEELRKSRKNEAVADLSVPEPGARPADRPPIEAPTPEQGFSRLKKARERAQERFDEDEKK
jgi:uncharacterized membrane protein